MADSLVLTGVKHIKNHAGTEMLLRYPKGGGDTFQLKRWWVEGGINTVYVSASVFDVTTAAGTVKLAVLTTSEGSRIRIDHDGSFNFDFFQIGECTRAALYTDGFELIEHYVFPSMSGGKTMTVTPPGAADRPTAGPPPPPPGGDKTIDSVTINGKTSVLEMDREVYTAVPSGNATPYTYTWSVDGGTIDGIPAQLCAVIWDTPGTGTVTCVVGSSNAEWDNNTIEQSKSVTVTEDLGTKIDSVSIAGELNPSVGDTETYVATITGDAGPFVTAWYIQPGLGTINSGDGTDTIEVTWDSDGDTKITCAVVGTDPDYNNRGKRDEINVTVDP